MVISLREIASRCLGLRGNFSIVRDVLGYAGTRVPGPTSLSEELILFRDGLRVHVCIKIVSTTSWTWPLPPTAISIDEMIFSMRLVFRNSNLAVSIRSTENLTLADTDIDVGACNATMTTDQNTLFNNRNNVTAIDIVVYFVRSVLRNGDSINGCASHPAGRPGAAVASIASRWTLVHEIGHVLGNPHIENETPGLGLCPTTDITPPNPALCMLNNIMTCCGTGFISAAITPTFNNNQTQRIRSSSLVFPCQQP
jgi:hypothetical protein